MTGGTTGATCRICGGTVQECLDLGRQPVSNAFLEPKDAGRETFYRLTVGFCTSCTMVQQLEEVPRDAMFRTDYPYRSSLSTAMRDHFEGVAQHFLDEVLTGPDPFLVEIGSNDGVMLNTIGRAGVRHLGVDPSRDAAEVARRQGTRVLVDFFEESTARAIRAEDGPADVIYSANCFSHIAYIGSILRGVDVLLAPEGLFVFEDRYLGDIIEQTSFDQIYDEHFYLFAVHSVRAMAERFGFELVDVTRLAVHGGAIRYTVARPGVREPSAAVHAMLADERRRGLAREETFLAFGAGIERIRADLVKLLGELRADGRRVVGYGATSRSATVTGYCGIGPDLVPFICDSTPEKQGRITPGSHIPIRPPEAFRDPYPDYALLFAWNHAEEIMAKERAFREAGGRWVLYVPDVHVR
ncbi:methyltransferase domain-containing protein [Streptomyces sp. NPDC053048]|uniref:methyltransferase domain-containing protein n=1 Tax=Streptomyces sp. NPDC053048 TaxID=3365694 RepID=UPI0037D79958